MYRRNSSDSSIQTSRADPQGEVGSQSLPPQTDYFPLAPMTAIAMLWWIAIDAPSSLTGIALITMLSIGIAFCVYQWLCGSFQRALLLSVGLGLVFCMVLWRVLQIKAFSLGVYSAVLFALWLVLKFGARIHVRTRELDPDEIPYRSRASREFSLRLQGLPFVHQPTSVVEEMWITVSTVFQPRYPAAWSKELRRERHWQATLGGFALIACGLLVTQVRGIGFKVLGLWPDTMAISILFVAAGWSLVGIAYELRQADRTAAVRNDVFESKTKREPKL